MLKDLPTGSSSVSATPDGTAILRALPVAAALIDERLRYIDSNPEFATLARSCESALRGASCAQSLPIDPAELLPTLRRTLDSGLEGSVTAAPRLADDQAGQRLRCRCRRIDTASPCILLLVETDAAPAPPAQQQAFKSVLDNIFTFAGLPEPEVVSVRRILTRCCSPPSAISHQAPGKGDRPRMALWTSAAVRDQSMRVSALSIFLA